MEDVQAGQRHDVAEECVETNGAPLVGILARGGQARRVPRTGTGPREKGADEPQPEPRQGALVIPLPDKGAREEEPEDEEGKAYLPRHAFSAKGTQLYK